MASPKPGPQPLERIGILGGMGVEATLELLKRVHAATAAEDDQDHIPLLIDMNPQVPSRIRYLIDKEGDNPEPVLVKMAKALAQSGAKALAMPCNTAHLFAPAIEREANVPFLNMPKLACAKAADRLGQGARIGVLASPATYRTGLFSSMLEDAGLQALLPDNQNDLLRSIQRIKKSGPSCSDVALLESEASALADKGAMGVLIGCSEFSIVSGQVRSPIPVLDTLDVLVEAIVAFSGARSKETAL